MGNSAGWQLNAAARLYRYILGIPHASLQKKRKIDAYGGVSFPPPDLSTKSKRTRIWFPMFSDLLKPPISLGLEPAHVKIAAIQMYILFKWLVVSFLWLIAGSGSPPAAPTALGAQ
jgi:hypothetical protein